MRVPVTPPKGNIFKKKLRAPPARDKVPPDFGHPPFKADVTCAPHQFRCGVAFSLADFM